MTDQRQGTIVDLQALRRSCSDCSLRSLCLPAGVDVNELGRVDEIVHKPPPLARGQALFRAGDRFHGLHVVRSGSLKTIQLRPEGEEQVMGFHLPGELVGLEAIDTECHNCDGIALERSSVCTVPMSQLEQAAASLPSLQRQLHRIISREIGHDQQHLAALGRRAAVERLAVFIEDISRRLHHSAHAGQSFDLPMSRAEIASYLGLALETVSRSLSQLAEREIITLDRRRVHIIDLAGLATAAGRGDGGHRASRSS